MPRARPQHLDDWPEVHPQTAAAREDPLEGTQGSGCLSGYMIPPLAVLMVSCLLAAFAIRRPVPVQAQVAGATPPAASTPADAAASPEPTPFFMLTPTGTPLSSGPAALLLGSEAAESAAAASGLSPIFTPEIQYWGESIVRWASAAGLDPNLAAVIMQIESCGDPRALSRSGAIGLFQVMPFHFHAADNPYDPDTNALRGLNYLSRSLQAAGGDPRLAMAGYNGGIGVISRFELTWSNQTQRYVYFGAPIYEDARSGQSTSAMLNEWYSSYGASLCNQAHQRLGLP